MRMTKKKTVKKSPARIVLISILCVVLVFAVGIGALVIRKYATGRSNQKDAQDLYPPAATETVVSEYPQEGLTASSKSDNSNNKVNPSKNGNTIDSSTGVVKDFNKLYEVNKDTIGWISIPNTLLDLPVAQTKDNSYYLNHTITKKSHPFGTPFADYKATFNKDKQSNNLTIYGHAARDGSYFATIKKYKDVSFYKKNPMISFNTIYGTGNYKIIGLFMEDVSTKNTNRFNYHDYTDMDESQFNQYVENVMKRNYFTTGVDVKYGDQLISLSTCDTEVNNTDYRVVLVARKVRDGETKKVDTSVAKSNVEQVMPAGWVDKKGKKNPFVK